MRRVEIVRSPSPDQRDSLVDFVERIGARTGSRPLSDHLWLDLTAGSGRGLITVSVWEIDRLLALAQVSLANDGSALEVAVDPDLADADRILLDAAETAADAFRRDGGGTLTWWVDGDGGGEVGATAAAVGLRHDRTLYEMRRPLPHPDQASIETRAFTPSDADAWLSVNNRAFASHSEQGGWTRETLALRMAEDWFDPEGFRLYEIDGELAGFCWTKIHRDHDPGMGEIYVIAVDPAFHGRGLGRQLTLAGLDAISKQGITLANLYVDAANTSAVRLYEGLGFTVHRSRTALAGTLGTLDP